MMLFDAGKELIKVRAPSGVQALNRKARYRGIVAGCQTLDETQAFPSAVGSLTQIAASLQHAVAHHAPFKVLQDRYPLWHTVSNRLTRPGAAPKICVVL